MGRRISASSGFTLVELMMTTAIVAVLASIALPSYGRYQSRARQAEAKVLLSQLYGVEATFFQRFSSFSLCLSDIGFSPGPGVHYYSSGFRPAKIYPAECGPTDNALCNTFNWTLWQEADVATKPSYECDVEAEGKAFFPATTSASGGVPVSKDLALAIPIAQGATPVKRTRFTAAAYGKIFNDGLDIWQINEAKQVFQTQNGIE
jgi:prepilin-type N-terminal cleavage/methylation domain-containing protein